MGNPSQIQDQSSADATGSGYVPPAFEVTSLDCEITSYAPDDRPLF